MTKKRLITLIGIFVLVLSVASPAAAGTVPGTAQDDEPAPLWPSAGQTYLFLPTVSRVILPYVVSGQVKNAEDLPLAGVNVIGAFGPAAKTDANGVYRLAVAEGAQEVVVEKEGFNFKPATAEIEVSGNMNNLNFSAVSANAPDVAACTSTLLVNSNFEDPGQTGWIIRDVHANLKNKSRYTDTRWWSPAQSMLSGAPTGIANPFPGEWTTGEFYQATTALIPTDATVVQLQMRLLPDSTDLWGYHIAEQAAMDAAGTNMPEATEAQYGFVCTDGADSDTCNPGNGGKMLFKWFPIDSYMWLYRSYDLRAFRGETISVLLGASNDGYNGNTALYVDDVYLYYCTD